jgi:hypothetical protein
MMKALNLLEDPKAAPCYNELQATQQKVISDFSMRITRVTTLPVV